MISDGDIDGSALEDDRFEDGIDFFEDGLEFLIFYDILDPEES